MDKNTKYQPEYVRLGLKPIVKDLPVLSVSDNKESGGAGFPPLSIIDDLDGENYINNPSIGVIDNNEFIDLNQFSNMNYSNKKEGTEQVSQIDTKPDTKPTDEQLDEDDIYDEYNPKPTTPKINEYIILVFNKFISSGNESFIKNEIEKILIGKHKDFYGKNVSLDDLIILKRVEVSFQVSIKQ